MVSSSYEKAKKQGRASEAQWDYLNSHGFDMTGIERRTIAPEKICNPPKQSTMKRWKAESEIREALIEAKEGY